jgi:hypothetical protein
MSFVGTFTFYNILSVKNRSVLKRVLEASLKEYGFYDENK